MALGSFRFSFSVVSFGETGIWKSFLGLERLPSWGTESRNWGVGQRAAPGDLEPRPLGRDPGKPVLGMGHRFRCPS